MHADLATGPSRRRILQGAAGLLTGALAGRTDPVSAQTGSAVVTKPIPHSGEQLPVIGLGTANESMTTPKGDARTNLKKVVDDLLAQGCKLIDTASSYGSAENVLGDLLSDQDRAKVFLATKIESGDKSLGLAEGRHSLGDWATNKSISCNCTKSVFTSRIWPRLVAPKRLAFGAISGSPRPIKTITTRLKPLLSGRSRTSSRSIIRWPTGTRRSACFRPRAMPARRC